MARTFFWIFAGFFGIGFLNGCGGGGSPEPIATPSELEAYVRENPDVIPSSDPGNAL